MFHSAFQHCPRWIETAESSIVASSPGAMENCSGPATHIENSVFRQHEIQKELVACAPQVQRIVQRGESGVFEEGNGHQEARLLKRGDLG